ncbi:MAG: hypothetical protein R3F61_36310 [Myxococcota bacterium]
MKRSVARLALGSALLVASLACGGAVPVAGVGSPCCSIDDVIRLTQEGVSDELIIYTIRTSGTDLDLSADDIVLLTNHQVSPEVIDVLNGGPCVCEAREEPVEPAPTGGTQPEPVGAKSLHVAVKYSGGKSMEVVNLSKTDYTNVTVVINDEYQYRLKKLKANAGDFMRFSSFILRRTGAEGKKIDVKTVSITADQGTYTRSF